MRFQQRQGPALGRRRAAQLAPLVRRSRDGLLWDERCRRRGGVGFARGPEPDGVVCGCRQDPGGRLVDGDAIHARLVAVKLDGGPDLGL